MAALGTSAPAQAANPCFDFSRPEAIRPLHDPLAFSTPERPDTSASGPLTQAGDSAGGWGAARAILDMPLARTLALLRDQSTLKDPKEAEFVVSHEARAGLLDFQGVRITIHPFPLLSLEWVEQWAYRLLEGGAQTPRSVLIAYQKTAGTTHIRRFCGNIWLKAAGPAQTDFAVYEETDATHRTAEDIARGHLGTIRTLRARATAVRSGSL